MAARVWNLKFEMTDYKFSAHPKYGLSGLRPKARLATALAGSVLGQQVSVARTAEMP
jgi:hypothetical protein